MAIRIAMTIHNTDTNETTTTPSYKIESAEELVAQYEKWMALEYPEPSVYVQNGYIDRADYLTKLAEEHGYDLETVQIMADLMGPDEDFDSLITSLEDGDGIY